MNAPLSHLHVVVTRPAHQAAGLVRLLTEYGARVTLLPTVGIAPPADPEPLRLAAASLTTFDLVVFTSANAVRALAEYLPTGATNGVPAAAVGPATSDAARASGFAVRTLADRYVAEALAEALDEGDVEGKRILLPSAAVARDVVPNELRRLGADVTVVEAYRNICPPEAALDAPNVFKAPLPAWALFASPSAFENLLPLVDRSILRRVRLGSIGPTTSAAILAQGFEVAAEARLQTSEGIVAAIENSLGVDNTRA